MMAMPCHSTLFCPRTKSHCGKGVCDQIANCTHQGDRPQNSTLLYPIILTLISMVGSTYGCVGGQMWVKGKETKHPAFWPLVLNLEDSSPPGSPKLWKGSPWHGVSLSKYLWETNRSPVPCRMPAIHSVEWISCCLCSHAAYILRGARGWAGKYICTQL